MGLNVKNISYRYGKREIVNDVSFVVHEDEIITLFGPSGVGKTTILKMIVGMLTPQTGTIEFTGESTRKNTLLVFQDYLLFPHMTVAENIAFGLKMRHVARAEIDQRVQEMVAEFQLEGLEKQYPAELSGGQQQRVALARAIILRPKLLLLDEPFSSLDSNLRQQMYEYLQRLQAHYHFGVIMVSHDQEEAFLLSTRVVVLANQRVQQVASPQELYAHPANRTVADFLGCFNYLTGEVNGQTFAVAGSQLSVNNPGRLQGTATLLVPFVTQVGLTTQGGLSATVQQVHWQPAGPTVIFDVAGQQLKLQQTNFSRPLKVGEQVRLTLPAGGQLLPCQ
ncbi:ABC transporter ATP-binding protein [Limosilactobacillus antri]|uniref:ABC-type quaternary amine transporter n=1 Tax=Limosilactobacillus antri DSM 16041 TaxID=525309 RepID=C8P4C2_9LACO|nr:ABC transporter ATP-binding protein [Limosilactobacillus antri]EEW54690.1 ABC transporter, ATP-binding protein [Limosilactobacillus antri DSM 16041]KRK60710.1 sulfate thiosulfate ABC superfamily ATP binding cassette transporter, ABC protein [Limosilactobacillus antri DSM 16041]